MWWILFCCNLRSLSSGVSAATLSHSRVLLWCEVACLSLAVGAAPSTIPLPPLSQSFTFLFAVSAAHWALSLSFLCRCQSSCSCADLRVLPGLLWASMFKATCSLKLWVKAQKWDSSRLEYHRVSSLFFYHVLFSIFCPHRSVCACMFRLKRVTTSIYGATYIRQIYHTHSKLRPPFLLVRFSYKYGGGAYNWICVISLIYTPPFLDTVVCNKVQ